MDEVLIDGSEIRCQDLIQGIDDTLFRFHGKSLLINQKVLGATGRSLALTDNENQSADRHIVGSLPVICQGVFT